MNIRSARILRTRTCSNPRSPSCRRWWHAGCAITSCNSGYADCTTGAGCETQNSGYSNTSAAPEDLLTWDADAASGFGCPGQGCQGPIVVKNGVQGRYFKLGAHEASSCNAYVALKFELIVPAGSDYALFVTGNACFADPAFSQTGTGNKVITLEGKATCPVTGRTDTPVKTVLRLNGLDKRTLEMFNGSDGANAKTMEITYTRSS